jgi:GT2 family glycosyltransferase
MDSIIKYTDTYDHNKEFIIVSNGCGDDVFEYLESIKHHFTNIKILKYPKALGYTVATNIGIKNCKGEYVLLYNNDNVLLEQGQDDWLNYLYEPFKEDKKMGITGCHTLFCPSANRNFILFFCALIKRNLFKELGYLDEIFNPGAGEDTDFCCKTLDAGYNIKCVSEPVLADGFYTDWYPIWHKAEVTVKDNVWWNWDEVFERNGRILKERYQKEK